MEKHTMDSTWCYADYSGLHSHNLTGSTANNGSSNENLPKNFTLKLWFRKF